MNGKGSKPRPLSVSREEFNERWGETFRKRVVSSGGMNEGKTEKMRRHLQKLYDDGSVQIYHSKTGVVGLLEDW